MFAYVYRVTDVAEALSSKYLIPCLAPIVFVVVFLGLIWLFFYGVVAVDNVFRARVRRKQKRLGMYEYRRMCRFCGYKGILKPGHPHNRVKVIQRGERLTQVRSRQQRRSAQRRVQIKAYQPYLNELLDHWQSTYKYSPNFTIKTDRGAYDAFRGYQRALGEIVEIKAGYHSMGHVRNYYPSKEEMRAFIGAYANLRRGNTEAAAKTLQRLTQTDSQFADAWLWRTATTNDLHQRIAYLEEASRLEPAHPLVSNALAVARGVISADGKQLGDAQVVEIIVTRCPQCGGSLRYDPDETAVICLYCNYRQDLQGISPLTIDLPRIANLRLQRLSQESPWRLDGQSLHCQACGAALTMTRHLTQKCVYCGSTNVLVEESPQVLEQPDGIIPFTINEQKAKAVVKSTPLYRLNHSTLHGIYVPFWVFGATVETRSLHVRGNQIVASCRDQETQVDRALLPGVDVPPISLLDQMLPYDFRELENYDPTLLAGWAAQRYNLDVEVVVEDAYDTLLARASLEAGPPVRSGFLDSPPRGTRQARVMQVNSTSYQLVLLPVWVVLFESKRTRRIALVNGQTGKLVSGLTLPGS